MLGQDHVFRTLLACGTLLVIAAPRVDAQALDVLHHFGYEDDGWWPNPDPIEASDGALYGTTYTGGVVFGGIVFRVQEDGTGYLKIHDFDFDSGQHPVAGVIEGADGALYGTTANGGDVSCPPGCGIVFKLLKDGTGFRSIHDFADDVDGWGPRSLIEGEDGVLYGTTSSTLFRLNKDGTEFLALHHFGGPDAEGVGGGILEGSDGLLYGTTGDGVHDAGTIFKINKDGSGFVVLHHLIKSPVDLIEGSDGMLYGTAHGEGRKFGVVFRINKDGSGFSTIHTFKGLDGEGPTDLVDDPQGAIYGGTAGGGAHGHGIVFRMNKDGSGFTSVHDFTGIDGRRPVGLLLNTSDGALYGTSMEGGERNRGVVFRLAVACQASVQVLEGVHVPGSAVRMQVHIEHHRPKTVTVPWELRLLDARGQWIARHTTEPHTFQPGDVVDREVQFRLPDDLKTGTYTLELAISGMAGTKGAATTFRVIRAE
jgi:uncharacterized repeat protein (TIGR03803 family)